MLFVTVTNTMAMPQQRVMGVKMEPTSGISNGNEITDALTKKVGRPPLGEKALTGRERVRNHRARLRRKIIDAIGAEDESSDAVLLELLRSSIRHRDVNAINRVLRVLTMRYSNDTD